MTAAKSTPFNSEAEYSSAIDEVLLVAQKEICLFDPDLERLGLEEKGRAARLETLIAGAEKGRLRGVVHDASRLNAHSPRLQELLRRFPLSIEFRLSPENMRHLADCMLLADGSHGVIRFHADHARGKQILHDPVELAPRILRFEELWQASQPLPLTGVLGL